MAIKKGESRDNGNIKYTRHRTITKITNPRTMTNTDTTKNGNEPRFPQRVRSSVLVIYTVKCSFPGNDHMH